MTLEFYTYRFLFAHTFKTGKGKFKIREGVFIHFQKNGIPAWGEAAPLPGFSQESLQDLIDQIRFLHPEIMDLFSNEFSLGDVYQFINKKHVYPSLQFGLYTLSCFYLAQLHNISPTALLFDETPNHVEVNAVIDLNKKNIVGQVSRQIKNGFKTVKLKATDSSTFIEQLTEIRRRHPHVNIRLDANQSWSLQQAIPFLQQVEPLNIEYCEEPLSTPDEQSLETLRNQTGVTVALDESLINIFSLQNAQKVAPVFIIKPMILGLSNSLNELKSITKKDEIKLVFTSSLESGIGRLMTAFLAAGLGTKNMAHGLSTGNMLQRDVWDDERFMHDGSFVLPKPKELQNLMQLNPSALNLKPLNF